VRDISPAVYDLSLAQQVRTSMPRHQSNSQVVMKNESTLISYYMIDCIGYIYKTRKIVIPLIIGIYIKILNNVRSKLLLLALLASRGVLRTSSTTTTSNPLASGRSLSSRITVQLCSTLVTY